MFFCSPIIKTGFKTRFQEPFFKLSWHITFKHWILTHSLLTIFWTFFRRTSWFFQNFVKYPKTLDTSSILGFVLFRVGSQSAGEVLAHLIRQMGVFQVCGAHSLKHRPGGSNSRNDPGVWLVYSDSTRRAEHAHICETSQRVANSGIRALWSWKFW